MTVNEVRDTAVLRLGITAMDDSVRFAVVALKLRPSLDLERGPFLRARQNGKWRTTRISCEPPLRSVLTALADSTRATKGRGARSTKRLERASLGIDVSIGNYFLYEYPQEASSWNAPCARRLDDRSD